MKLLAWVSPVTPTSAKVPRHPPIRLPCYYYLVGCGTTGFLHTYLPIDWPTEYVPIGLLDPDTFSWGSWALSSAMFWLIHSLEEIKISQIKTIRRSLMVIILARLALGQDRRSWALPVFFYTNVIKIWKKFNKILYKYYTNMEQRYHTKK